VLLDAVKKKVIAIDSSTKSVAWSYFEGSSLLSYGKFVLKDKEMSHKLEEVCEGMADLVEELSPDYLIIESPFYGNNVKTVVNLAMIQGAIIGVAKHKGVREIASVPPIAWQKAIGNEPLTKEEKSVIMDKYPEKSISYLTNKYREVRKERTISYVNDRFLLRLDDDDIADAVGIGCYVLDQSEKVSWE